MINIRIVVVVRAAVAIKIRFMPRGGVFFCRSHASNVLMQYRTIILVPGYFAADGNAAETSAISGRVFRAHLAPPLAGTWSARVEFTSGTDVAVFGGGTPVSGLHGTTTSFTIAESDKVAPDLRAKGMLLPAVGERYLVFNGTGERFLKSGADSPENLLAYYEFDGTWDSRPGRGPNAYGDWLHHYDAHFVDWRTGDPTWQGVL